MSIFYEFNDVLDNFRLGVIDMEHDYQASSDIKVPENITHPFRRKQYVAAREALLYIDPDFPLDSVVLSPQGKPVVEGYPLSFSLSHSSNYAAALVVKSGACGFDIELPGKRLTSLKDKFVSSDEFREVSDTIGQFFPGANEFVRYGLCWSAKESTYKLLGQRELNFRDDMRLFASKNDFNTHVPYLNCRIEREGEESSVFSVFMQWQKPLVITWAFSGVNDPDA